jgi:hypothetical protein
VKEVEELAESFGHPDTYRELLRFYEVRRIGGTPVLRRAQRLWEITRDANDEILWRALSRNFESDSRIGRRRETESFELRDDFVETVWREAGKRDVEFGLKLSDYYYQREDHSRSINILQELIETGRATPKVVATCVTRLLESERPQEARILIERYKNEFGEEPAFAMEWAEYAIRTNDSDYFKILTTPQYFDVLRRVKGSLIPLQLLIATDRKPEAKEYGERLILLLQREPDVVYRSRYRMSQAVEAFSSVGLGAEIIEILNRYLSDDEITRLRRRYKIERP